MKSFRLDGDLVAEFLDSWPTLLIGGLLVGALVYVGFKQPWAWVAGMLLCGVYGGYELRGVASGQLRKRYPNARFHWLLSIGMATLTIGAATREAFRQVQGTGFDLAWLGVSFCSILAFVVANRQDEDVIG
jgi:hypothetical protein